MAKFNQPVVYLDLETTGVDVKKSRIIQIGMCRVRNVKGDGGVKVERGHFNTYVNPGCAIPEEVTEITGIMDGDVESAPSFSKVAGSVVDFMKGCSIVGFNLLKFDLPLLSEEFARAGQELVLKNTNIIDVGVVYKRMRPRTLEQAYREFVGGDNVGAHDALADAIATELVLDKMVETGEIPSGVEELDLYSTWDRKRMDLSGFFMMREDGNVEYTFGKNKGKTVDSDPQYLSWMANSDFPADTKRVAAELLSNM